MLHISNIINYLVLLITFQLPQSRLNKAPLLGTLPNGQSPQMMTGVVGWRTTSVDSQFDDENLSDDEEMSVDMRPIQRRMSVDEKTLRNAVCYFHFFVLMSKFSELCDPAQE
jgi:hypothetical protein